MTFWPHGPVDRYIAVLFLDLSTMCCFWESIVLFCFLSFLFINRHYAKQQGATLDIKEPQVTGFTFKDKKSTNNFKPDTDLCPLIAGLHFWLTASRVFERIHHTASTLRSDSPPNQISLFMSRVVGWVVDSQRGPFEWVVSLSEFGLKALWIRFWGE